MHQRIQSAELKAATEWGKMFSNHTFDKGLVSRIYKELLQPNPTKPSKHTELKMVKDLKSYFSKDDLQMTNRHMKRGSKVLIKRKTKIKMTMRYSSHSLKWLLLKTITNVGEDVVNVEWCAPLVDMWNDAAPKENSMAVPKK